MNRFSLSPYGQSAIPPSGTLQDNPVNVGQVIDLTRQGGSGTLLSRSWPQGQVPLVLTLSLLDIVFPAPPALTNGVSGVVADLRFGTGNALQRATVDVSRNTQVAVVAEMLEVVARIENTADDSMDPLTARVSASLGVGVRAPNARVTRTFRPLFIEDATSQVFEIPNFARSLQLFGIASDVYVPGVELEFSGTGESSGYAGGATLFAAPLSVLFEQIVMGEGVGIPGTAQAARINNTSGADVTVTPCFVLNL